MRGCKLLFLLIPLMFLAFAIPQKTPPADDLQFSPPTGATQTVPTTAPALELPCVARGSELLVEKIVSYEGDFWEDGTNAYAAWPGEAMAEENGWYAVQAPGWINSVIINGNAGSVQTADLSVESGVDVWVVVTDAENASVTYEAP